MGRYKSLGSLKSFLSCASQLPGASTLHLSSVLTLWTFCSLMAATPQALFSFLIGLEGWNR